jgi:hypothetical protein
MGYLLRGILVTVAATLALGDRFMHWVHAMRSFPDTLGLCI